MDRIGQWLWVANLATAAVLAVRIAWARLYRTYPFLFVYFLVYFGAGLALLDHPVHSNGYAITYMTVQPILHIVALAVVLEIYRVALAKHPGLANFGRDSVWIVIAITVLLAAVGALLDKEILSGQSVILHRFFTLERTLEFITFLFLLLITIFITWFPVELPRNVTLCIGGFSLYYLVRAAALLAVNHLPPRYLQAADDATFGSWLLILAVWSYLLRPDQAGRESVAGHSWDPEALERVSRQLDSINSALVRLGRR